MGTHPDATRRHRAEQSVEARAVATLVNRIDPDEHAIKRGEPCAHGVSNVVLVDHGLRIDADMVERREDSLEPTGFGCGSAARDISALHTDSESAEAAAPGPKS